MHTYFKFAYCHIDRHDSFSKALSSSMPCLCEIFSMKFLKSQDTSSYIRSSFRNIGQNIKRNLNR